VRLCHTLLRRAAAAEQLLLALHCPWSQQLSVRLPMLALHYCCPALVGRRWDFTRGRATQAWSGERALDAPRRGLPALLAAVHDSPPRHCP
jgi:hypothetical protein